MISSARRWQSCGSGSSGRSRDTGSAGYAYLIGAEIKAGELLREMEKNKGARGNPGGRGAPIVRLHDATAQPKLSDIRRQQNTILKLGPALGRLHGSGRGHRPDESTDQPVSRQIGVPRWAASAVGFRDTVLLPAPCAAPEPGEPQGPDHVAGRVGDQATWGRAGGQSTGADRGRYQPRAGEVPEADNGNVGWFQRCAVAAARARN